MLYVNVPPTNIISDQLEYLGCKNIITIDHRLQDKTVPNITLTWNPIL